MSSEPKFRILAPQFICPKDNDAPSSGEPDQSVIRFQMPSGSSNHLVWTVRWRSHGSMSQRSTLLLWRTIRSLEQQLNEEPLEPNTFVIENSKLLSGVDYFFNVTAVSPEGEPGQKGNFSIAFEDGKRKLELDDVADNKFSVLLLGSDTTYAHVEYILEAQFVWHVVSIQDQEELLDVSDQIGGRLKIPAATLRGGREYDISCELYRSSDNTFLTKVGIFLKVLSRGLLVHIGLDELIISRNKPVQLSSVTHNYDNLPPPLTFEWSCSFNKEPCSFFKSQDNEILSIRAGFPEMGEYEIMLQVSGDGEKAEANLIVQVVEPSLPVIQVEPISRLLNEGTKIELVGNASNIAPSCSIAWYFATDDLLASNATNNDTCDDCEHGELIGQTITIFSMEETFLNELADFSNTTEGRELIAIMPAASGRARLLAACGCSETFSCETEGTTYADIYFKLNASPNPAEVMVSPDTGTALDTTFRLSTLAVMDRDPPIRYTFYYTFGNSSEVALGSYINYIADEAVLPYIEDGVSVGVEVCDVFGACGRSSEVLVTTTPSTREGMSDVLADAAAAHLRRCELEQFSRVAVTGLLTFTNAQQMTELKTLSTFLVETLKAGAGDACIKNNIKQYYNILNLLTAAGIFDKQPLN